MLTANLPPIHKRPEGILLLTADPIVAHTPDPCAKCDAAADAA